MSTSALPHLRELLEHLLVGEIEHLVRLLRRVERLVRLGLNDVVRPLEDAHAYLPWSFTPR